jgi:D-alanyl-D-alanine dipeptidase
MFYASDFNFVGRPIKGYNKPVAILTEQAAHALKNVQDEVKLKGLSLKVIDAYRPQRSVDDFWDWAKRADDLKMQAVFYPHYTNKTKIFDDGYIWKLSSHSRGSTVDLTLVDDNGDEIDMGSQIDMLDSVSNTMSGAISREAHENRMYLKDTMVNAGFDGFCMEWWHFTLRDEPFTLTPQHHFDFVVE